MYHYTVVASGLAAAGITGGAKNYPFVVERFLGSVPLLVWAQNNVCPWKGRIFHVATKCGSVVGRCTVTPPNP